MHFQHIICTKRYILLRTLFFWNVQLMVKFTNEYCAFLTFWLLCLTTFESYGWRKRKQELTSDKQSKDNTLIKKLPRKITFPPILEAFILTGSKQEANSTPSWVINRLQANKTQKHQAFHSSTMSYLYSLLFRKTKQLCKQSSHCSILVTWVLFAYFTTSFKQTEFIENMEAKLQVAVTWYFS